MVALIACGETRDVCVCEMLVVFFVVGEFQSRERSEQALEVYALECFVLPEPDVCLLLKQNIQVWGVFNAFDKIDVVLLAVNSGNFFDLMEVQDLAFNTLHITPIFLALFFK